MSKLSHASCLKLSTCHPDLYRVISRVAEAVDCTVIEGHRTAERQAQLLSAGRSQTQKSKHLSSPSMAVDVAPNPVDWNDRERFTWFGGYVLGVAAALGVSIRWGGDWNMDNQQKDNKFDDLVHFELIGDAK